MKNRRFVIGAFLLVAVLCLGVGFAALQQTLTVSGTLSYDPADAEVAFDEDVYFTGTPTVTGNAQVMASITAEIDGSDNDKLEITVAKDAFTSAGQSVTVTATVKNDSTDDVEVSFDSFTQPSASFEVVPSAATTITAGGEGTVTITITLKDTSTVVTDAAINMTITAQSAN